MKFWNKKMLGSLILLAICFTAVYWLIKTKYNLGESLQLLLKADLLFVGLGLLMMPLFVLLEGLNIGNSLKIAGIKSPLRNLIKYAAAGFFFSQITPSASGGQPAQLIYMKKDGIKLSHGTFALMLELLSMQTAAIFWGIAGMIYALCCTQAIQLNSVPMQLFLIGLGINLGAFIILVLIMFTDKPCRKIAGILINLSKTALVRKFLEKKGRSTESAKLSILRSIAEYKKASRVTLKEKKVVFKMLLISLIQLLCYHLIIYFSYLALGGEGQKIIEVVGLQALLFISVSALPLPGAAGVTEYGFSYLFRETIPPWLMGGTIILSRGLNFIWPLLLCGMILLIEAVIKMVKKVHAQPAGNDIQEDHVQEMTTKEG